MRILLALLLLCPGSAIAQSKTAPSLEQTGGATEIRDFKDHYTQAFQLFTAGEYSKAIEKWNEVLKIDGNQKTALKMIRTARKKINDRDKKEQKKLFIFAAKGQYQAALLQLQPLLERDSTHPLYIKLQKRLELLAEIVPKVPNKRAWRAAARGLVGYIAKEDDLNFAFSALRHARDISPSEKRFASIRNLLLKEDPTLEDEKITPGMKFLEYKRSLALGQIYNADYVSAVTNLNVVISLEPNDLVSLKRIGSAYFQLKRYKQAERAWLQAIKLSPKDKKLKKFVAKARRAQRSSKKPRRRKRSRR
jgi:tetratricopeptide (TPR) repeat protein